ncbi:hypothetical protein [Streptomyces sp. NPDC055099]
MSSSAHTTLPSGTEPDRGQSTPITDVSSEQALTEIARLANQLCEHLADSQWHAAARVRDLAETTLQNAGDR